MTCVLAAAAVALLTYWWAIPDHGDDGHEYERQTMNGRKAARTHAYRIDPGLRPKEMKPDDGPEPDHLADD